MKGKTINQINSFCARNQTIEFFRQIRSEYNTKPWADINYRLKEWNFNQMKDGSGEFWKTPMSNFIYSACAREIERFCGYSANVSDYRRAHLQIESKNFDIRVQIVLSLEFGGVFIQAVLSDYSFIPSEKFKVKSNETFDELDILKYFERILSKTLFAPGLFRDIQIQNDCSKARAKEIYKGFLAELKRPLSGELLERQAEKALRRNLRNHYNLIVENFLSMSEMVSIKNKYGKQARKTNVENFPLTFNNFEAILGDGDIDEIESNFYDYLERDAPTIFI